MLIPKQLLPITRSAPKDVSRYTMSAVFAERLSGDRVRLTATDGTQLITVDYPDQSLSFPDGIFDVTAREGFSASIPVKTLEEAGKSLPTRTTIPGLGNVAVSELVNGKLELATTDLETTRRFDTKPMGGKFPDYRACLPSETREVIRIGFDPKLLAKTLETVAAMLEYGQGVELLVPKDGTGPVEIRATNTDIGADIRALVMPRQL